MIQWRVVVGTLGLWCAGCFAQSGDTVDATSMDVDQGVFELLPQDVYKKACDHRDWVGLRANARRMMQQDPEDIAANRLYQIARALCGERPQVLCGETLVWYMVHYLGKFDTYRLSEKKQKKVRYFTSHLLSHNKRLLASYPTSVQQFVYLRIARGAAGCNATQDLVSALDYLLQTPCTEVQRRYWQKVRHNTQRGILSTLFKIGSDSELQQHIELWGGATDSELYRAQRSDRATKEDAQRRFAARHAQDPAKAAQLSTEVDLRGIEVTDTNISSIFDFLRSRSIDPAVCKRALYQMIRVGKYEYAVDLLDWYGDTLRPIDADEARLQVHAYFKCGALDQVVQLLAVWGERIPDVQLDVMCYMRDWDAVSGDARCKQRGAWDRGHWSEVDGSDARKQWLAQYWLHGAGGGLECDFAASLQAMQRVCEMYPALRSR